LEEIVDKNVLSILSGKCGFFRLGAKQMSHSPGFKYQSSFTLVTLFVVPGVLSIGLWRMSWGLIFAAAHELWNTPHRQVGYYSAFGVMLAMAAMLKVVLWIPLLSRARTELLHRFLTGRLRFRAWWAGVGANGIKNASAV
jgi:hypothetical protein